MAGIVGRIKEFARSPQGRRTLQQVKRAASDPRKREQAKSLLGKFKGRGAR